jgi:SP family sugar:H+ symporter-like MFS transporter
MAISKRFHIDFHKMSIKKPPHVAGSSVPAILTGLFVAFGGILFGYGDSMTVWWSQTTNSHHSYDTGTIGGIIAMRYWLDNFSTGYTNPLTGQPDITSAQSSLIVSILSAGTFFGALFAAPLGDFIGRRIALMITVLVFCFGVILQTASTAIPLFVAGRFFAGFGVGLISALSTSKSSKTW